MSNIISNTQLLKQARRRNIQKEYIRAILKSRISFLDKIIYILPKSVRRLITGKKYQEYAAKRTELLNNPLTFAHLGTDSFYKKFRIRNYNEFFTMVRNIIQRDSYKTKKYIHKNSIVIDVGANVGLFSLAASAKAKKVYAFEPNPVTFEILASHLSLWECGNCTPVQYGLGEKSDSKTILYNDEHLVWSRMEDCGMNTEPVTNSAPVEIVTLDEFASKSGVEYISFIKIDTEGYEMNVLKGAREIIKKHKPVIAISSYHKPEDITEIPAFLYSLRPDYKMMHSKRGEEDFIFA